MQKYLTNPDDNEFSLLDNLFSDWCSSANPSTLNHLFEIIESHESPKIRELALFCIKRHFPRDKIKILVDFWITHPLPEFHPLINELIESDNLSKQLLSVVHLMRDEIPQLYKNDPDFKHLDNYLNALDPLLGSLVFRRYAQLKKTEGSDFDSNRDLSLIDLIRLGEYQILWDNLLDYPVPFICELLKIFREDDWIPQDLSDIQIFDELLEYFGEKGWKKVQQVIYLVVSKRVDEKFLSLSDAELRDRNFHLRISPDITHRPDRIVNSDFISRGFRSISDTDLGIDVFEESIRKSDVDGMLHVPMYATNGIELAEFAIPASSPNSFFMDDDGLFFTINSKKGVFTVDLDSIAAFVIPISKHSSAISDIIMDLQEKATGRTKMVLKGLDLLSTLHRGREFTLFDTKEDITQGEKEIDQNQCLCTLSIDIGDSSTKIFLVPGGSCDHDSNSWEYPTVMYYQSPTEMIIGADVIEKDLMNSTQTFKYFKNKLKQNIRQPLRIHTEEISAEDAYIDFLNEIIGRVKQEIGHDIEGLAMSFSLNMPSGFDIRIRRRFKDSQFKRITVIDELTAITIKYYRMDNLTGNTLFLNLGTSQISCVVADLPTPKSRKRTEVSLFREKPRKPPRIHTRLIVPMGLRDYYPEITKKTGVSAILLDEVIKETFNGYEDKLTLADLNEIIGKSDLFNSFTYIIRDALARSAHRGVRKDEISQVVISGKPISMSIFREYVEKVFAGIEVISKDSVYDEAIGAGLINNGQNFIQVLDQDYFCRISNGGITNYTKILSRGDEVSSITKVFEIQRRAWFDKIVLDIWSRRQRVIEDDMVIPLKDNEMQDFRRENRLRFNHFFLTRELLPVTEKSTLIVEISRGILRVGVNTEDSSVFLDTDIRLL